MSGLIEDPFDWRVTKDGRVLISRGGAQVSVVGGARASRLIAELPPRWPGTIRMAPSSGWPG